ncbi:unnamed protein product [Brugia pahangi]|uniref:Uncharacterized protein n=1 Tax=Brugia pahangi TaxID=6280 RepID=A0A0N4T2E6_BRUPA|nr:unnamed protein product [Brugia pahangi]
MDSFFFADVADTSPNVLELSALLDKQNKMLSALLGELETCKSELLILRNGNSQQINSNDTKNKVNFNGIQSLPILCIWF